MKTVAEEKKYKILVAEDDKFLIKMIRDELEDEGFDVVLCVDGNEAIGKLKKEKPDLVLLDIIMPVKDGFDVLAEMKLSDEFTDIPVVLLSNLGQEADIKRGLELGTVDYFVKSDLSIGSVAKKVKEHLAKSKIKK